MGQCPDAITQLVDRFAQKLANEQPPQHRTQIQREIDTTDRQMDRHVYDVYGLSDDESAIVEEATR